MEVESIAPSVSPTVTAGAKKVYSQDLVKQTSVEETVTFLWQQSRVSWSTKSASSFLPPAASLPLY